MAIVLQNMMVAYLYDDQTTLKQKVFLFFLKLNKKYNDNFLNL